MKLRGSDSRVKRVVVTIAAAAAIMLVAGLVYVFLTVGSGGGKVNGMAILLAAQTYTREMKSRGQPVPQTVSLKELMERGFLKPEDAGAFRGMDVTLSLTTDQPGPKAALMRVHLPDGSDVVLLADGSVQEAPR